MNVNYRNPPVVEGIVNIHAEPPSTASLDSIKRVSQAISNRFPLVEEQHGFEGTLEVGPNGQKAATRELGLTGFLCWTAERKQAVRLQVGSVAYSCLQPYIGWDGARSAFSTVWDAYRREVKPINISRIGLRYINRIQIPEKQFELSQYLTSAPNLAVLGARISNFVEQKTFGFDDSNIQAQTVLTVLPSENPNITSLLFDIDTWIQGEHGIVMDELERLRAKRTDIFESVITEKTRRLFQ